MNPNRGEKDAPEASPAAIAPDKIFIPCNLCGSTDGHEIRNKDRHGGYLRTVICRHCGLVWSDPRPTPEQVREFYAHEYRMNYKGVYQPQPKHTYRSGKVAVNRCRRLKPMLKPGMKIMDVGAGSGEVVYVLQALGCDVSGFEPNEGYAKYASDILGVKVTQGFYQDTSVPPESLDMITLYHVLEHMEDPYDVMKCLRRWLKPGGYFLVEIPNVEAVCQQPHTQFHRGHLHHFNQATLQMMGRKAGFTVSSHDTSTDGGNIWAIFQKSDVTPPSAKECEMPANYERVAKILRGHTGFKHFFTPHPYQRIFRKLAARSEEQRSVRLQRTPKEVLDALIAEAFPRT